MSEGIARLSHRLLSGEAEALQASLGVRGRSVSVGEAGDIVESLGGKSLTLADDIIRVWRNGELQAWRVDPNIAKGIRAMQPGEIHWLVQTVAEPSPARRA